MALFLLLLLAAAAAFAVTSLGWLVFPRLLMSTALPMRAALIIASAVAAGSATSAATGWFFADAFWRMALGAGAAALGAYANPLALVAATAVLAVAGDGAWGAVAAAGCGAAGACAAVGRRSQVVGALAGATAALTSLHLDRPDGPLAATSAATAGLGLLAAAGFVGMSRERRRRVVHLVSLMAVPLVALFGLGAYSAMSARADLEEGVRLARSALAQTRTGDFDEGRASLQRAEASFLAGAGDLDAWWALPARALPVVGANLDVAATLAGAGAELSGVGDTALASADFDDIRLESATVPVERLAALREPVRRSHMALAETQSQLSQAPRTFLVPPLANGLVDLESKVADAQADVGLALEATETLPRLLGANGARRYFLAIVTPSETRGSGGIIGNFGEIVADDGTLTLTRLGRASELNDAGTKPRTLTGPPEYLARYARFFPEQFWQNVTLSPDFPTVASVIAELYPQSGGEPIDGVIAVDPVFLARLLDIIGPVEVPGLPEPLTAGNVEEELLFGQYLRFENPDRIDFLGTAAARVWQRFTTSTLPGPRELAMKLGPAVAQRHLQVASLHQEDQGLLDRVGISGKVASVNGDFLGVVTQNAGGNKLDWFLDRSYSYDVVIDEDGALEAELHLELRNRAPATGLPQYVIGPFPGIDNVAGQNRLMLSIYTPWAFDGGSVNGQPLLVESLVELDRWVYSAFIDVPAGATSVVDVTLSGTYPKNSYRLDVLRQPMIRPDDIRTSVRRGR